MNDALFGAMLDRHLAVRQKSDEIDEQAAGHDDRALTVDLCVQRRDAATAMSVATRCRRPPFCPKMSYLGSFIYQPSAWTGRNQRD
jgi:hypothetical protein